MEYLTEVGFPTQGLRELAPFAAQEPGTSPDMLNVVPFDTKGRLRGGVRPGLDLWSSAQVNSTNPVQCLQNLSASDVSVFANPSDFRMSTRGNTSGTTGAGMFNTTGTEVKVTLTHPSLGTCFGADGRLYCLTYTGTTAYLECYDSAGTEQYVVSCMDMSVAAVTSVQGFCEDSGIIYVYYLSRNHMGEPRGISRYRASDGANLDLTDSGLFIPVTGSVASPPSTRKAMDVKNGVIAFFSGEDDDSFYLADTKFGVVTSYVMETLTEASANFPRSMLLTDDGGLIMAMYDGSVATVYLVCHEVSNGSLRWGLNEEANDMCQLFGAGTRSRVALAGFSVYGTLHGIVIIDTKTGAAVDEAQSGQTVLSVNSCGDGGLWCQVGSVLRYLSPTDFSTSQSYTLSGAGTNQYNSLSTTFLNSGNTDAGSARYNEVISISNGTAYKMTTSSSTAITGGTGFQSSIEPIFSISYGALVLFADGTSEKYYSPRDNEIADWRSRCTHGELPSGFRYIEHWKGRVFLFGFSDDPSNWYTSAKDDAFDWEISTSSGAASSGRKSAAGVFPGKLQAVIPYDENLCILGGDGQIRQLKGDPAANADMDFVSDTVGIAAGRAWCKDGYGNVYFFGANGGLYRLTLNAPPQRVSVNAIDERLLDIDTDAHIVTLQWDEVKQGVWIFLRPTDDSNTDSYFYSVRTNGFFPVRFGSADFIPLTTCLLDHDDSMDQKILYACEDGYIRTPVDGRALDATDSSNDECYESYYKLGPWTARQGVGMEVAIDKIDVMMADNSQVDISILESQTAEGSVSGDEAWKATCSSAETTIYNPEVGARALTLRVDPSEGQDMSIDRIRMAMRDQGHNA